MCAYSMSVRLCERVNVHVCVRSCVFTSYVYMHICTCASKKLNAHWRSVRKQALVATAESLERLVH